MSRTYALGLDGSSSVAKAFSAAQRACHFGSAVRGEYDIGGPFSDDAPPRVARSNTAHARRDARARIGTFVGSPRAADLTPRRTHASGCPSPRMERGDEYRETRGG